MNSTFTRLAGVVALVGFFSMGCSTTMAHRETMAKPASPGVASIAKASDLRAGLNALLGEHVLLAAVATSHALGGRQAAFNGAVGGLDANSVDIARAIGSVYGGDAEKAFLPLWRKHIGFIVDYTVGVSTKDTAKQDKAVSDLVQYTQDFGAFLSSANPNLPKNVVADLVKTHALTLKDVIDAQAAGDFPRAYSAVRIAYGHMQMIGDPLSAAIVKQFPDRFAGSTGSSAAGLRTALNQALREHVVLAAMATGSALGGRTAEFKAAAGAVDANSMDIAKAIGSVYGADAENAFLPLWRKHIGFVVDYTVGVATKDTAKQDKAVSDLVQYTEDFGAFLSSANPNLPKNVVAGLVKTHALTLKDVIDAQAAKDWPKVYASLRMAAGHMQMIADPLAGAIVKQFPERFAQR